jgi:hypothetical protein
LPLKKDSELKTIPNVEEKNVVPKLPEEYYDRKIHQKEFK